MLEDEQNVGNELGHPEAILDKEPWHNAVDRAVVSAKKTGNPMSVIFIDVNSFKQINDTLGHAEGDVVIEDLRQLIALVINNLRTIPEVGREIDLISPPSFPEDELAERPGRDITEIRAQSGHIGGDEFSILAHTDARGVRIIKARLIEAFEEYKNDPTHPEREAYRKLGVGIAIGASTLTEDMKSSSGLLKAADEAMYEDKINQLEDLNRLRRIMFWLGDKAFQLSGVKPRDTEKYRTKYKY